MRNLKKILALVLALVMSFSLMATANAFTDDEKIDPTYEEAVNVLSALKVFEGRDTGDFDPQASITRAEVAAIIYRIDTGDVNKEKVALYSDYAKFTDVKSTDWFAGYVGYCANAEFIKGYGDGKFGPNDPVTGYQALAMILRAVGYDKAGEFTGAGWQVQVAKIAKDLGITDNIIPGTLGTAASREVVAELLFRSILVPQVNYTLAFGYQPATILGSTASIGYETFGLVCVEGVVTGNEYAVLNQTASSAAMAAGKSALQQPSISFNTAKANDVYAITTDVDVIGQNVYFYALKSTVKAGIATYTAISAATPVGNNVVDYSDTALTAAKKAAITAGAEVYNNYGIVAAENINSGKGVTVKAIDNDGDGKYEYVLTEKDTMAEVKYIGTDGTIYLNQVDSAAKQVAGDLAIGDVVLTITYGGRTYIEKAAYVTGNISSYVESVTAVETATINGEAYEVSGIGYLVVNGATTIFDDVKDTFAQQYNGRTYNYYQDAYGNIRAWAVAGEQDTGYGLILAYDLYKTGAFAGDWYVRYLTVENTVETKVVADESAWWAGKVGTVVKYRLNSADEFVAVYNITNATYGDTVYTDDYTYPNKAFIVNKNSNPAEEGTYNITDDFVAFYYLETGMEQYALTSGRDNTGAFYGVLTGADAVADLDDYYYETGKSLAQYDAVGSSGVHTTLHETLAVVNINDVITAAHQYCYIFTDTKTGTFNTEDGLLESFSAVNANGEPITVYSKPSDNLYLNENPVWAYATKTVNFIDGLGRTYSQVINEVEPVDAYVGVGDLHADQANDYYMYLYGPVGDPIELYAPYVYADVSSTAGGTTSLSATYCSAGYVVYSGDYAYAVFVEMGVEDHPYYVDTKIDGSDYHLLVGSTFPVASKYVGGTYSWTATNGASFSKTVPASGEITIEASMQGVSVTLTAPEAIRTVTVTGATFDSEKGASFTLDYKETTNGKDTTPSKITVNSASVEIYDAAGNLVYSTDGTATVEKWTITVKTGNTLTAGAKYYAVITLTVNSKTMPAVSTLDAFGLIEAQTTVSSKH